MNKVRRKGLVDIFNKITELKDMLENIKDEEECNRDNIPENLQVSERYAKADNAVDKMEEAISYLEEATDSLEEIIEE